MAKLKSNIRKSKGITLVALVVTIIILLILAGISIAQLTGNGLFENAKLAKEKSENAQQKENTTLGEYENKIEEYVDGTREEKKVENYSIEDTIELDPAVSLLEGKIKKSGNVVDMQLSITFKSSQTANVFHNVGTLKKESLIPDIDYWGYLANGANGGNTIMGTDGILKIRGVSSTNVYVSHITYIVD